MRLYKDLIDKAIKAYGTDYEYHLSFENDVTMVSVWSQDGETNLDSFTSLPLITKDIDLS